MSMNEIYRDADSVPYPVPETTKSGDLVVFASGLAGVAEVDAKPSESGGFVATIRTKGIWVFPMGAGVVTAGDPIYSSTIGSAGVGAVGTLTTSADDGESSPTAYTKVGTVYRGKPSAAGNIYVRIGA